MIAAATTTRHNTPLIDPTTPPGAQPVGKTGRTLTMSEEFNGALEVVDADAGYVRLRPAGPLWRCWYPNWLRHSGNSRLYQGQSNRTGNPQLPERQIYTVGANMVAGGRLTQTAALSSEHRGFIYESGCVTTHPSFSQQYGYWEVSARLPNGPMGWPAIWMFPEVWQYTPALASVYHEIDIVEIFNTSARSNNHGAGKNLQAATLPMPPPGNTSEYHTYGLEWTPTRLDFYYDGVAKGWDTGGMHHIPMFLILNLACYQWNSDPTIPPSISQDIEYVRVWSA